ncbi:MAG: fasciclin domain-containing protein [Salaquimonas sp.]
MKNIIRNAALAATLFAAPLALNLGATTATLAAGHGKTVVEIAVGSPDHKTLVAAVTAAGLVDTLSGDGPFTVFAPVDSGFAALPEGTVDTLLKPDMKDTLTKVLTAHVVSGTVTSGDLVKAIKAHGGRYNFSTISGDALTATLTPHGNVWIYDESGGAAKVVAADIEATNGVVHAVSKVLLPK